MLVLLVVGMDEDGDAGGEQFRPRRGDDETSLLVDRPSRTQPSNSMSWKFVSLSLSSCSTCEIAVSQSGHPMVGAR